MSFCLPLGKMIKITRSKKMKREEIDILKFLGFTDVELDIVETLHRMPTPQTAQEIKESLGKSKSTNLHKTLNKLSDRQIISKLKGRPARFRIKQLKPYLYKKLIKKEKQIGKFLYFVNPKHETVPISEIEEVTLLSSRDEYRKFGQKRVKKIERRLRIIASGRPQDPEFFKAHVDLVKKGISVQVIANRIMEKDIDTYENWEANGIKVKWVTEWPGLNMIIYDNKTVQIAIKENFGDREKKGVVIDNQIIASFFAWWFYDIWEDKAFPLQNRRDC